MTNVLKINSPPPVTKEFKVDLKSSNKRFLEKRAQKLKKHRTNMVEFRLKKKEQLSTLQNQHRHLERTMKKCLRIIQNDVLVGSTLFGMTSHYTMRLGEVVVEKEALRLQNIALRKKIENHETFREVLRSVSQLKDDKEKFMPVHQNDEGWWVHFPNNAPSFYFNPFSAKQIGATSNPLDYKFPVSQQAIGNFLGWEIYQALPEAHSAHVRFTKSVRCSLDTAYKVAAMREQDLRPLLRTPEDWSFTKRSEISTQILQKIDADTRVMVHNIPGQTQLRYVFLARTAQWKLAGGRRKMGLSMIIVDSEENMLSRDSGWQQQDVEWITDGWALCTMTEADNNTVDVVYEQSGNCQNESHARLLMTQWIQFIVRWEQIVFPTLTLL